MAEATTPTPAPTQPSTPEPAAKPRIAFDDFAKVDLRVARILSVEDHPKADRLFKLQVDDGSDTPRQLCAGIKGYYRPEDLVGRLIVIVANLEPRIIRGEESRGMLLAARNIPKDPSAPAPEERRVILLRPDVEIAPGSIVS